MHDVESAMSGYCRENAARIYKKSIISMLGFNPFSSGCYDDESNPPAKRNGRKQADHLCLAILNGTYPEDERIPSVRDFAASVEVNANTAVRAYEWLQQQDIIYTRRGLGYFVAPGAKERIRQMRRTAFLSEELPSLFQSMRALGIEIGEIEQQWNAFQKKTT